MKFYDVLSILNGHKKIQVYTKNGESKTMTKKEWLQVSKFADQDVFKVNYPSAKANGLVKTQGLYR